MYISWSKLSSVASEPKHRKSKIKKARETLKSKQIKNRRYDIVHETVIHQMTVELKLLHKDGRISTLNIVPLSVMSIGPFSIFFGRPPLM